ESFASLRRRQDAAPIAANQQDGTACGFRTELAAVGCWQLRIIGMVIATLSPAARDRGPSDQPQWLRRRTQLGRRPASCGSSRQVRRRTMRTHQFYCRLVLVLSALALTAVSAAWADDAAAAAAAKEAEQERQRYRTAVALNYCRAAFHHIRKTPTKAMLLQQQQQILNNLNLDGIDDPEIIRLYTAVLDEIGDIEIADRERQILQQQYRRNITQKITWDALA